MPQAGRNPRRYRRAPGRALHPPLTQNGRRTQYNQSSVAFSGLVANPLVAAPGYTRGYRVKVIGSGGSGATVNASADAPGAIAALVQLKDSFGTPLIVAPGYEAFQLIQNCGGQFGLPIGGALNNVLNLPTFVGVTAGQGNFLPSAPSSRWNSPAATE